MLGAFADRKDPGAAGLQVVVDHDAAVDGNAGLLRQRDIGADAAAPRRIGVDAPAVDQFHRSTRPSGRDARGVGVEQDLDALALDQGFQEFGGGASSWRSISRSIRWSSVTGAPALARP